VGYFTLNSDGTIRQLNLAGARLLGTERSRLVNRRFGSFCSVDTGPAFDAFLARLSANQDETKEICEVAIPKEGEGKLLLQIEAVAVGNGQEYRAVATDITDRKLIEYERATLLGGERVARGEAERLSRAKDEFLATVSHELRSPLSAILGWVRLARKDQAGSLDHALEIIERSGWSLSQLIDDLLDMSRITMGKVQLTLRTIDPVELIEAVIADFMFAAEAKKITLEQQIQPDLAYLRCDSGRIRQVLANLLSNALKFTPEGGRVSVHAEQDARGLNIRVTDNGEGIAPEYLSHLFDKFQQGDALTTRKHGGLGLGLSIVKQLVEIHGGTVQVESEGRGKGAAFTIILPITSATVAASDLPGTSQTGEDGEAGSKRETDEGMLPDGLVVLLVDDEPEICELFGRVLAESGVRVLKAHSAADARMIMLKDKPDVLISDISMPNEDGYTLIRTIRSSGNWCADIACIALTSLARPEDREHALQVGFDEHLSKTNPSELIVTVRRLAWASFQKRLARQKQDPEDAQITEQSVKSLKMVNTGMQDVRDVPAHILLAEDHESIAAMLKACLEEAGHRVSVVASVADGAALASRTAVDLLLSDLRLNGGTGWDLMSKLREIRATPGIMMSGYSDKAYIDKSKAAGFAEYLTKPVEEDDLLRTIKQVLKQAR
jgi:signal transduction histidine kinase/CheY-like chemotaxis protein